MFGSKLASDLIVYGRQANRVQLTRGWSKNPVPPIRHLTVRRTPYVVRAPSSTVYEVMQYVAPSAREQYKSCLRAVDETTIMVDRYHRALCTLLGKCKSE